MLDLKIMLRTCAVIVGQLVEAQQEQQERVPKAAAPPLQTLVESARKSPRSPTTILRGLAESAPK
jgi:hypothetical protein